MNSLYDEDHLKLVGACTKLIKKMDYSLIDVERN